MQLVYITRFAFTKGILVTTIPHDRGTFIYDFSIFEIGKDAFLTVEEARAKVEEMRNRRIKEYEAKIEKIKNTEVIIYGENKTTDIEIDT